MIMSALAPASRKGGYPPSPISAPVSAAGKKGGKAHLYIIPIILNILRFLGFCSLLLSKLFV